LDLKHLSYFLFICERGSINKAAQELFISQQGLNRIIRNLENELDVQLFLRTPQGVQLTAPGKIVLKYAKKMLNLNKKMNNELGMVDETIREQVWVSFFYAVLDHLSNQFTNNFRLQHSDIDLLVGEHPFSVSERLILEEKYDIALGYAPINKKKFTYSPLKQVPWPVLVHKSNPLADYSTISCHDLASQKLFLMSNNFKAHNIFLERCKDLNIDLNIVGTVNNLSETYRLVQQNKGIAFSVTSIHNQKRGDEVIEIPLEDEVCFSEIGIFYKKGINLRPPAKLFFEYACECAKNDFLIK